MHYEGNIIRPPSEANSILLQVTVGCSRNKCTFCGTYQGERFKIKSDEIIMADIDFAAQYCRRQRRVFLCDGDALIIPQKRLLKILQALKTQLPWVTRVGAYANAKSLEMKSPEQLANLKAAGLGILYMGLESGDDVTLKAIQKGATAEKMIAMARKTKAAGFKLSVTVLLGIAGRQRSQVHRDRPGTLGHGPGLCGRVEPDAHSRYAVTCRLPGREISVNRRPRNAYRTADPICPY